MKKILLVASLVTLFTTPAFAQETPQSQLEFVRKLRAKGYADLAMEYLDRLKKQNPPAEMQAFISLETARAQIDMSHTKSADERISMFKAARTELENYIKSATGAPAARAKLELARLMMHQGKALLSIAHAEDEAAEKQQKALVAEKVFIEAGKELEATADLLAKIAAAEADKTVAAQLEQERREAKLERGIAYMEQADCYLDLANEEFNLKRATIAEKSVAVFDDVRKSGSLTNSASLLAAAWLMRAFFEKQDPTKANDVFLAIQKQTTEESIPAKRLVRYFRLLTIPQDATIKVDKQKLIVAEAQAWLDEFKRFHDTPEGQGVRFEMAKALFQEARQMDADPKAPKGASGVLYDRAKKLFADLADSPGEFAGKATGAALQISLLRLDKSAPLNTLKGFNEPYLRGRNELMEMSNTKEKDKRDVRLKNAIEAFQYALTFASDKNAPPAKVAETKYLLVWANMLNGDLQKTIQQGELLAKAVPTTKHSPAAAGYTLEAYSSLLSKQDTEENRKKFREFAKFILETKKKDWGTEPVTGVTMYHLALLAHREDNFKEAVELFESLPTSFSGYNYAQGQVVFIALQGKNRTKDEKEAKFFEDKMLSAMKRITLDGNSSTVTIYFLAQLEYPKMLYTDGATLMSKEKFDDADKKFVEMDAFMKKLRKEFDTKQEELSQDKADAILNTLEVLGKYAQRGRIDVEFRRGNYSRVVAADLAGAVVANLAAIGKGGGPIKLADYKVTGDILGLALRSHIQLGKIAEAKVVLDLMRRLTSQDGSALEDPMAQLRIVVYGIEQQIQQLRKQGNDKKRQEISTNFSTFLDEIYKSSKTLQPTDAFLLAKCYDTIEQNCKAAELYDKVTKPAAVDKKMPLTPEEERDVQTYWYSRVSYARQLRLCKDKKENPELAYKVLQEILTNKNARQHMRADFESNLVLEDLDPPRYGTAITRWGKFLANPVVLENMKKDQSIEEMYYEGYVHYVQCCFKYSQQEDVVAKMQDAIFLTRAADWIARLEIDNPAGWEIVGPRLQEIIASQPLLRLRYEELKEARKKAAAAPK